jgi:hypothetical protein
MQIEDVERADIYDYPGAAMFFAEVVHAALSPEKDDAHRPPGLPRNVTERLVDEAIEYAGRVAAGVFDQPPQSDIDRYDAALDQFAEEEEHELTNKQLRRLAKQRRREELHRIPNSPTGYVPGDEIGLPPGKKWGEAVIEDLEKLMRGR